MHSTDLSLFWFAVLTTLTYCALVSRVLYENEVFILNYNVIVGLQLIGMIISSKESVPLAYGSLLLFFAFFIGSAYFFSTGLRVAESDVKISYFKRAAVVFLAIGVFPMLFELKNDPAIATATLT